MIYTFRILSAEDDQYIREIEIDSNSTFLEFHSFIQKCNGFDPAHLASFFLCDDNWERVREITLLEMGDEAEEEIRHAMDITTIGEFVKEKKQKLIYLFDFFADRGLFIELVDIRLANPELKYPLCTLSQSEAPAQFLDFDSEDFLNLSDPDFPDWDEDDDEDNIEDLKGFDDIEDL